MDEGADQPRALFLSDDGGTLPDSTVCSGLIPSGKTSGPCRHSESGRMPRPRRIEIGDIRADEDRGHLGDLAPPCAAQALGSLGAFLGARSADSDPGLLPLRVFKCRMMYLLVVPGLRNDGAGEISIPPMSPTGE
jgi:hypothetical protein